MSRRNKTKVNNEIKPSEVMDAFSNPLFRLGLGSQGPLEATEYPLTRLTDNYALMNSLYRDNWIVQNVVGIIPDDMCREGFLLTGSIKPEEQDAFDKAVRQTRVIDRINKGLRWGRLYGGAAALIIVDGQDDLSKPLDLGAIIPGAFKGLYVLDRWTGITPNTGVTFEYGDPVPESYNINTADGQTVSTVHHSRLIRFVGRELPQLEEYTELYWGASEVESLYKEVVAHDNVSANMAALTFRANIDTMEVQNLDQLFSMASGDAQRRFWSVMQAQSVMKSNFGYQLVNKGDQIENTQYTFTGLKDVYDAMCLNLCGCSHIPATKLFGRSPSGLNSTGESDIQNYYDYLSSQREMKLRPALEKLLPVLCMHCWGYVPDDIGIEFPPLWTPTAKEVAEIAKYKTETVVMAYQAGLLNVDAAQKELKKLSDDTGLFDSITDDEIEANAGRTYQDATALRDPLMGLM